MKEKQESKIFTKTEYKIVRAQLAGDKKDPTGIYANRAKKKLKEMLEVWLPMKKQIDKLLKADLVIYYEGKKTK